MVRFIGDNSITSLLPELVCHPDVASAGQAQAWVVGPGRGTDAAAAAELRKVLALNLPAILDADALTLLATNTSLRQKVTEHPLTILTPHEGEFIRLYEATFSAAPSAAWGEALHRLAEELNSIILLKGRLTRVTAPGQPIYSCNAGHSFAATPGSGDVLRPILALGLITDNEHALTLTYFWGIILNPQAIITPDVIYYFSPRWLRFATYWFFHIVALAVPLGLTFGLGSVSYTHLTLPTKA